ncbi:MAG: cysteine desulfurase-like protein [Fuerstiella sp.]|nr:cysteine desulfurase-like protein [Fuerstiella sp.]MCP4856489.1 cysteine desulfurase-like protein [Fuerstiella sp.]
MPAPLHDHIEQIRGQFPALARRTGEHPSAFFDGPAGTQVPQSVIDAVSRYFVQHNANHGGLFPTSRESDVVLASAHQAVAEFLGSDDPGTVSFGPNMTTLTLSLSRALGRTWNPGDEVIVSRLDHDANFTPWVLAAADAGATVRYIDIDPEDCTLDLEDFEAKLNDRTRLVAVGCASNAVGSVNPVKEICRLSRRAGALTFLDAVHFAPHSLVDVNDFGCDFLACSAYKFFGPHVGILWGRRPLLEELTAYKLRPASDALPDKWMTGTQNHECIAGTLAAVDYLTTLGRTVAGNESLPRRPALEQAYQAITDYEQQLIWHLIDGLRPLESYQLWGIADPLRRAERLPTISITHSRRKPAELAEELGRQGLFVWHGNYYALPLTERLGLEPDGMIRVGIAHYNTLGEVDRLLGALRNLA